MPTWVMTIFVFGMALYVVLFADAITSSDSDLLQALTIVPVLIGLTVPLAVRMARNDDDPTLASIVMAAVTLKLMAAYVRYYVAYEVYSRSDSRQYHDAGELLASSYRSLDFSPNIGRLVGTGFIKATTGVVYAIIGTTTAGGFLVFAFIGFLGLLLLARAFRAGVPNGDSRRYTIAVLFFPTLLYWPSAVGKEAWMMLAIGLAAYGIARIFARATGGLVPLALGLVAMILVRPHMALIFFVGLVFALLVQRRPARTFAAPLLRVTGLVALLALGLFLSSQTATFLGVPSLTTDSVTEQLDQAEVQTADGGSQFDPVKVNTPIDMVPAFATVFFRPFPLEASSGQELASAMEGILLIGLLVASRNRLRSIPRLMRTTPYVAFSVAYVLAFVFAFSSFANFGILARQRTQALPFLLVLIALPRFRDLVAGSASSAEASPAEPAETTTPVPEPPSLSGTTGRRRSRRPPRPPLPRTPVSSGPSFAPPPRSPR